MRQCRVKYNCRSLSCRMTSRRSCSRSPGHDPSGLPSGATLSRSGATLRSECRDRQATILATVYTACNDCRACLCNSQATEMANVERLSSRAPYCSRHGWACVPVLELHDVLAAVIQRHGRRSCCAGCPACLRSGSQSPGTHGRAPREAPRRLRWTASPESEATRHTSALTSPGLPLVPCRLPGQGAGGRGKGMSEVRVTQQVKVRVERQGATRQPYS
jgi:hypothetical protein